MSRFKSRREAALYLAAMIDGEGCVVETKNGPKSFQRLIGISNTEEDLLQAIIAACECLDLKWNKWLQVKAKKPTHNDVWEIVISGRRSLEIVNNEVPLQSVRKRDKLAKMVSEYKYAARGRTGTP